MVPMIARPLQEGVLERHGSEKEEDRLGHGMGFVGAVREVPVIARADRDTDRHHEQEAEERLPPGHAVPERVERGAENAHDGREAQEQDVGPVFFARRLVR